MNPRSRFVQCALGVVLPTVFVACFADRPLLTAVTTDDGPPGSGSAGAGSAGSAGPAGTGITSQGGGGVGCDITPIITGNPHNCTIAGACHDAQGSAAGLDLASPGLETRLLGGMPRAGIGADNSVLSKCANQGRMYLVPG